MRIRSVIAVLCFALGSMGYAQTGYTTVTGAHVPGSNATSYWQPVVAAKVGGAGGQISGAPIVIPVTSGAMTGTIPDALASNPTTCYAVTVIDNATQDILLGAGLSPDGLHVNLNGPYGCVQPTGSSWNFDAYVPNDAGVVLQVAGPTGPTGPTGATGATGGVGTPATSIGGTWYLKSQTGFHCDGVTDDTAAFQTFLSTVWYPAGGGTIHFEGCGLLLNSAEITIPNNSGSPYSQPPLRLTGGGSDANGQWATATVSQQAGYIDLEYNAPHAKLLTLGTGTLEIDHMSVVDKGSDCGSPLLKTTYTTLFIHNDVFQGTHYGTSACNVGIVLGDGSHSNAQPYTAYQGYGTVIRDNFFSQLGSTSACNGTSVYACGVIFLGSYANDAVIEDNTFSQSVGAPSANSGIIDSGCWFNGGVGCYINGVKLSGNLFETGNSACSVHGASGFSGNTITESDSWDNTATTVAFACFDSGAVFNVVVAGYNNGAPLAGAGVGTAPGFILDNNTTPSNYWLSGGGHYIGTYLPGPFTVQAQSGGIAALHATADDSAEYQIVDKADGVNLNQTVSLSGALWSFNRNSLPLFILHYYDATDVGWDCLSGVTCYVEGGGFVVRSTMFFNAGYSPYVADLANATCISANSSGQLIAGCASSTTPQTVTFTPGTALGTTGTPACSCDTADGFACTSQSGTVRCSTTTAPSGNPIVTVTWATALTNTPSCQAQRAYAAASTGIPVTGETFVQAPSGTASKTSFIINDTGALAISTGALLWNYRCGP